MDQTKRSHKCADVYNNGMKISGDTNSKFVTSTHTIKNKYSSSSCNSQSLRSKINLLPDSDTLNEGLLLKESPDIYGERNLCSATGSLFMIKNAFTENDGEKKKKKLSHDDKISAEKDVHKFANVNNKFDKNCRNLYKTTLRNRHLANNKIQSCSSFENVGCSEDDHDNEMNTEANIHRRLGDSCESLFRSHYRLLGKIDKLNQKKGAFQTCMPNDDQDYFTEDNFGSPSLKSRSMESFQSGINSRSERVSHTNEKYEGKKKKSKIVNVKCLQNSELSERSQDPYVLYESENEEPKVAEDRKSREKNYSKRSSKNRPLHVEGGRQNTGEHKNSYSATVSADDLWERYNCNLDDSHNEDKFVSDDDYSDNDEHTFPSNDTSQHEHPLYVDNKNKERSKSCLDDFTESVEELLTAHVNIHEDGGEGDYGKIPQITEDRLDDNEHQRPKETTTTEDLYHSGDSEDDSELISNSQRERIKKVARQLLLSFKDRLKIFALIICQFLMILSITIVEHPYFNRKERGYFTTPYNYNFVVDVLKPRASLLTCNWLHSITVLLFGSLCLHCTNGKNPFKSIRNIVITIIYMLILAYFVSTTLNYTDAILFGLASGYAIFMQFYFCWRVIQLY